MGLARDFVAEMRKVSAGSGLEFCACVPPDVGCIHTGSMCQRDRLHCSWRAVLLLPCAPRAASFLPGWLACRGLLWRRTRPQALEDFFPCMTTAIACLNLSACESYGRRADSRAAP